MYCELPDPSPRLVIDDGPIVQTIIAKLQLCSWMYQSAALKVFPKRKQIQITLIEIDGIWSKAKRT